MNRTEFLKNCIFIDTETTSKDYKVAEIIETGIAIYDGLNCVESSTLYKPTLPIPAEVSSICYITYQMVKDCKKFEEDINSFQTVLNYYKGKYIIAHNHFYDMRVLERYGVDFTDVNWICTWRIAKKLFDNDTHVTSTNLLYLRFALDIDMPVEKHCHRAGNDCLATALVLEKMLDILEVQGKLKDLNNYGESVRDYAMSPIIYKNMPFGKHKGVPLTDIPNSYWEWAANNTTWFDETADNYDADFVASILQALG